jgi:hypothetical protein
VVRGLALVLCAVLLAGCGGTKHGCRSPQEKKGLARLNADLTAIREAAKLPVTDALKGGPQINKATDRFLHDVETAPVDNLQRNRLIDHAAALLLGSCTQCFQALEAERPIVSIAHGDQGCATTAYAGPRQRYARALPVRRHAPAS